MLAPDSRDDLIWVGAPYEGAKFPVMLPDGGLQADDRN
jgi:hypothetical protein